MMNFVAAFLCLVLFCPSSFGDTKFHPQPWSSSESAHPIDAPNIVIILLDDVGFGATSTFGGPIETPQLDKLASHGLRYNNFNTTGLCSPTRAALLTGRNHHRIGFGTVTDASVALPGYNGIWKKNATSIAEVLRRMGYSTAAFGKWHNTPSWEVSPVGPFDRWPTSLGFEYFYGFMGGEDSQWEPQLYTNTLATDMPTDGDYHLTSDITDQAISWLQTHHSLASHRPYLLYFAPGATHAPLHVPKEWIKKYQGKFEAGWDNLRSDTFKRQKMLGIIPSNAKLSPRPNELPAWTSLSTEERNVVARQMEVYAGFLAHTDHEIGRLIDQIQAMPDRDNTMIIYIVGDNGASGEGGLLGSDFNVSNPGVSPPAHEQMQHLKDLGNPEYDNHYASAWAWALNSPFQWVKQISSHFGSIRNPLVVVWPKRIKAHGDLRAQFTHVTDVVPTIYDALDIKAPNVIDGVDQLSIDGISFLSSFDQPAIKASKRTQYFEIGGNRAIYKDGWVASKRRSVPWVAPAGENYEEDNDWELYDIDSDFSQSENLAKVYPEKLNELRRLFTSEAERNLVYPSLMDVEPHMRKDFIKPTVTNGADKFVFHSTLPRITPSASPDFTKSHRIVAEIDLPNGPAPEGIIMSWGSRLGGFVIYFKNGELVYENNCPYYGKVNSISYSGPFHKKSIKLEYEFNRWPGGMEGGQSVGVVKFYLDREFIGETNISDIKPGLGSFSIGRGYSSPVSKNFQLPFAFNGQIKNISVEIKPFESMPGG